MTLYSSAEASVYSSLEPVIRNRTDASESVPIVRLDDRLGELGIVPGVVKVDVEGAEWDVLRGAEATLLAVSPLLILELSLENSGRFGCSPDEILAWLEERGYRSLRGSREELVEAANVASADAVMARERS